MMEFVNPGWLWSLFILLPIAIIDIYYRRKKTPRIFFSRFSLLKEAAGRNSFLVYIPLIIRLLIMASLIISLARPRISNKMEIVTGEGIDIIIALDISGSMQAIDFKPVNRMEAAKKAAINFIEKRKNDRIGIVTYADNAFTQAPLTLDYNILMQLTESIDVDMKSQGTAIGMGLAMSVARLKDSKSETKVVILLTDGINNAGQIDPFAAADLAETFGVRVYTIGVGQKGLVDYPVIDTYTGKTVYRKMQSEVDVELLNKIAERTGTERVRMAHDNTQLSAIFDEIDQLEKTEYKIDHYYKYNELFQYFLYFASILLAVDIMYKLFWRKEIP
ncbi:MAG: VWA domain-containing protein [Candidatus Cloacimonetes bacterium]|nr:VWA domain-containing protein [Candidatus Cloacimonadota bacterium]